LHSVGVDIIETERIQAALVRWGERFLCRVYSAAEVKRCAGRVPELAVRFAAKEAVAKALGTGMHGVAWTEIEILSDHRGKPGIRLYGRAEARARELGLSEFAVSLSHSSQLAIAFVVAS